MRTRTAGIHEGPIRRSLSQAQQGWDVETRRELGGPALLDQLHLADARASSHVNLEIVTCATCPGLVVHLEIRAAPGQQGAK